MCRYIDLPGRLNTPKAGNPATTIAMVMVIFLLITATAARAELDVELGESTHAHFDGFGTLALGTGDSKNLGFTRDTGQTHPYQKGDIEWRVDSSLGGQLFVKHDDWLEFVAQMVLRQRKENKFDDVLQYAFFQLHPSPNWTVRLGRNPHDIYFLSDTQNVGYSHTWLRPVKATYNEMFLDYYNGVDITYRHHVSKEGLLSAKLFTGVLDAEIGLAGLTENVVFVYKPFYGGKLQYESKTLRLTLSYQGGKITKPPAFLSALSDAWAAIPDSYYHGASTFAEAYDFDGNFIELWAGGIFYNKGPWSVQSEFTTTSMADILGLEIHAGYIGASYQIQNSITPFVRVARLYNPTSNIGLTRETLHELPAGVQGLASLVLESSYDISADHVNVSAGVRWDFHRNMALKFQWDHFDVKEDSTYILTRLTPEGRKGGRFNLFAVSLDFIF